MTLALIVEDGTGLATANSYIDTTYMRNYAALRGVALPVSDDLLIPHMIQAMDYLESLGPTYIGSPTVGDPVAPATTPLHQALSWPRTVVQPDLSEFSSLYPLFDPILLETNTLQNNITIYPNVVPKAILLAQAALTVIANSGVVLMPVTDGNFVISEKIGPIETKYSERLSVGSPTFNYVDAILAPYISTANAFSLTTSRG